MWNSSDATVPNMQVCSHCENLLLINSDEDHEVEKGGVISASKWLT